MGGTSRETAVAISLDASGNIYTSGYFEETVDFDPGAETYTLSFPGNVSAFVSKLDPQGNFLCAKKLRAPVVSTNSDAHAWSHVLCSNGDICVTGHFSGVIDFDPGAPNVILYAPSDNVFVVKPDAQGNYLWAKQFGGKNADMANSIAVDAANAVYNSGFLWIQLILIHELTLLPWQLMQIAALKFFVDRGLCMGIPEFSFSQS